ncbi:transcriptional regulator FtsR [Mycobacterium branderi]|uniref:HTH-type transcriptional regulator n=1 Tax=Mycobacterium branderi TaxID=43348 RepID=A0A7I7W9W7_9MYCO|nr:MerR family transcriptional regulator [Mycobacterium branderi]MCV7234157.1 MerR family transcriptional regulator [Mycobacterium branderi]ORA36852.1 MerR family transcriptional regulator [Mycobacterium branderi]BBZ13757.1 putative HTH-type transcriptional regulator [Mycobacterium branderi]
MTAPDTPGLAGMSIGAVLEALRPDFPDVTISKIRFLEAEGLVTPQRAASGYRRFTAYDCARLRFILTAQRDHYLPLKVIKAQLDAQPDGELPPSGSPYGVPRLVSVNDGAPGSDPAAVAPTRVRLSREDLLERSGVDEALLTALLKAGVITTGPGGFFDEHSVVILQCARALSEYGVEPRHLRAFRSAADRQSDLIAQIAAPLLGAGKAGKAGARDRADDLAREVAALAITLHTSLVKSAVRDVLHR